MPAGSEENYNDANTAHSAALQKSDELAGMVQDHLIAAKAVVHSEGRHLGAEMDGKVDTSTLRSDARELEDMASRSGFIQSQPRVNWWHRIFCCGAVDTKSTDEAAASLLESHRGAHRNDRR